MPHSLWVQQCCRHCPPSGYTRHSVLEAVSTQLADHEVCVRTTYVPALLLAGWLLTRAQCSCAVVPTLGQLLVASTAAAAVAAAGGLCWRLTTSFWAWPPQCSSQGQSQTLSRHQWGASGLTSTPGVLHRQAGGTCWQRLSNYKDAPCCIWVELARFFYRMPLPGRFSQKKCADRPEATCNARWGSQASWRTSDLPLNGG